MHSIYSSDEKLYQQIITPEIMTAAAIVLPLLLILICFFSVCTSAVRDSSLALLKGGPENETPGHERAALIKAAQNKYVGRCAAGMLLNTVFFLIAGTIFIFPLSAVINTGVRDSSMSMLYAFVSVLIIMLLLLVLVYYALPAAITEGRAERVLIKLSLPLKVLSVPLIPLSALGSGISLLLSRIFRREEKQTEQPENLTEEKILMIADEGEENGTIEENTRSMIENVFEFDDTTVGEIMTHRKDVVAVRDDDSLSRLVSLAIESGRSRLPVYHDDIDDIIGIIYAKDLLRYVGKTPPEDKIDPDIIRAAVYVPESKRCSEMFEYMTANKTQIAVVVDEFGGTGGIVTMEDLIESILGNIQDEYDNEDDVIKRVNEYSFTVDGATPLDEIEDLTGISFDEDGSDTIAGIMLDRMGHIPKNGEHPSIMINGTRFTVLEADQRRISRVLIVKSHNKKGS